MKFVVDMNLSPSWCGYLSRKGHDALHWSEAGSPDAPDAEIMRWADESGRIVLTSDLDFGMILAASGDRRPSVVQLRSEILGPDQIGEVVLRALEAARSELEAGALVTIDATRSRVRILPLAPRV
jgi:predicted nuclease of predicted toxin-antitoxin system